MNLAVRYWEGAVVAQGSRDGEPVTGRGYLELTGY
jgi:predicted secreted hydrolase